MTEKHKEPNHLGHPAKAFPKKDYQVGVEQEHKDLAERLQKINDFLVMGEFNAVHPDEQAMLLEQKDVMDQYLEILQQRIKHHEKEELEGMTDVEALVKEFGEEYRRLIESATKFLDDEEPHWKLKRPINRRKYIKNLLSYVAENK